MKHIVKVILWLKNITPAVIVKSTVRFSYYVYDGEMKQEVLRSLNQ